MLETLTFVTTLGAAVMGGVFYAFSTGVMQALGRLPSPQGAAAMQSVNIAVINPLFLGLFLGTAALCLGLCVAAPFTWDESGSGWRLTGALLYLVGSFVVTGAANVPLNNALAAVDPSSAELLQGATLDYKDGQQGAGFAIDNPNAQRSCGCGKSFS